MPIARRGPSAIRTRLADLPIAQKLALAFGTVALVVTLLGGAALREVRALHAAASDVSDYRLPSTATLAMLDRQVGIMRLALRDHMLQPDTSKLPAIERKLRVAEDSVRLLLDRYRTLIIDPEERRLYDSFAPGLLSYRADVTPTLEASATGDKAEAYARMIVVTPSTVKTLGFLQQTVALNAVGAARARASMTAAAERASTVVAAGLGVALVLCAAAGALITRATAGPVRAIASRLTALAEGDTSQDAPPAGRDEVGRLAAAYGALLSSQRTLAAAADRVAAGDLSATVPVRGPADALGRAFLHMRDALQAIVSDVDALTAAARDGRLAARGDASRHEGAFGALITGVNATLDSLHAPFAETHAVLERMATGDLTGRLRGTYAGEHAAIQRSVNGALDRLAGSLRDVVAASDQVGTAAEQIAAGAQALARGNAEQAGALEEMTSRLAQLSDGASRTAERATAAGALTSEAVGSVESGKARMRELEEALAAIQRDARASSAVVRRIDDIAFQTNLLALNAAVEAARAGDAGRGFAVVAEEVRALALRSATAARETAELLEASVRASEDGARLGAAAAAQFGEVESRVRGAASVMEQVTADVAHQREGVHDVQGGVTRVSGVTQQHAASSEESAATAEELTGQAASLRALVGAFTLDEGSAAPPAPAADARRGRDRASVDRSPVAGTPSPAATNRIASMGAEPDDWDRW